MRMRPSSPEIALDAPWSLNWLWFAEPGRGGADFTPEPRDRDAPPRPGEDLHEEWRAWRKDLWREAARGGARIRHRPPGSGGAPESGAPTGCDPPHFSSLGGGQRLAAHLRAAWPPFRTWWDGGAKRALAELLMAPEVRGTAAEARRALPGGHRLTVHAVALAEAQTLAERRTEDELHAAVSAGLLRDADGFRTWLVRTAESVGGAA
ncbi:hypothetical protein O4J56_31070 [Nocardiopsis sp. RSe5-2]|uniref:Uncharacterized protein n=1 Tax=Nocardiopsis endophytica TaxID=3018445 RepID=A0ABT4UDR4_9ACTN|nr:hypothetical protein [Nocardiopsis endophytica]MDA2815124.1 hypothetical protein [Nocardiopsis endophytica]